MDGEGIKELKALLKSLIELEESEIPGAKNAYKERGNIEVKLKRLYEGGARLEYIIKMNGIEVSSDSEFYVGVKNVSGRNPYKTLAEQFAEEHGLSEEWQRKVAGFEPDKHDRLVYGRTKEKRYQRWLEQAGQQRLFERVQAE